MALVRLAPQTVALLNALWGACRGIRPGRWPALDEALPGYRAQLQRVRAWLDFQSAYSLDEQEEALLGNLQFLLDELEQMAAEPPADPCQWARAACEKEMAFAGLAERLVARRQEPHFSSHPAFNELLTAGAALFLGRAQPRAVTERLPTARRYLGNLDELYRGEAPRLLPEVRQELEKGLGLLTAGLEGAGEAMGASPPDLAWLKESLARVKGGGEITQHLLDWLGQQEARRPSLAVPLVGRDLAEGLAELRRRPCPEVAAALGEEVLSPLRAFWSTARRRAFLVPWEEAERTARVDAALDELEAALDNLDPRRAEEAAQALEAAFEALERAAIPLGRAAGTALEPVAQAVHGIFYGTAPDMLLGDIVEALPPEHQAARERFLHYLQTGDGAALREGLCLLLEELVPPEGEPGEGPPPCVWCGAINPEGSRTCLGCGARLGLAAEEGGSLVDWRT